MTSTVKSWMFLAFSSMVFVVALTTAISLYSDISKSIDIVNTSENSLDRNVYSTLGIPKEPIITGENVALTVLQIPDTKIDIVVNGTLFPKTLEFDQIDISGIPTNKTYTANFERDTLGNLTKVIYTAQ
ncbi:hypothetical protein [Paenibacillus sp. Y412MC10]|uniref:hypothetical protein n=1 Tax=Geobacillus sp. (strain Y412MC10) TaxID=481743 RepID=UPI0011AB361B|nr:hypothetical protein [Paenibacillus sp. Y412MC10]